MVSLEEIRDLFSVGLPEPAAVRAFLAYAHAAWDPAPRYAVLAGDGTYDYGNRLQQNDNLVAPLLVSTPYGVYASDVARLTPRLREFSRGAAILVLDGSTYGRRIFTHLRIDEDLAAACEWPVERILLTQIGRSVPPHE